MNPQLDLFNNPVLPDSYHNTTNLKGDELIKREKKAKSQEEVILEVFRRNRKAYTPFDIHACVAIGAPITSVRRAITNLTKQGLLVRTNEQETEIYGAKNYKWIHHEFFLSK